jgi:hypothetical protein
LKPVSHPTPLPIANLLWVEGQLGPVERACLRSILRQGHETVLWHYQPLAGVPEGVILKDGDKVVPRERVFRHKPTGSYSLFSNLFRYELLRQDRGLWLDSDVYLLRPIHPEDGYAVGWGEPGVVGSAVLALPADSLLLPELIGYFDARRIPQWLPLSWRLRFAWQKACKGRYRLDTMPWGNLGPHALTRLLAKYSLTGKVRGQSVFSPWTWREADWIFDSHTSLEDRITPQTLAVHLFNEVIRNRKLEAPLAGSFLERLHRESA